MVGYLAQDCLQFMRNALCHASAAALARSTLQGNLDQIVSDLGCKPHTLQPRQQPYQMQLLDLMSKLLVPLLMPLYLPPTCLLHSYHRFQLLLSMVRLWE